MAWEFRKPATAFSRDPSSKATASFSDEAHLAFVRQLPSVLSGEFGCDAAHLRAGSAAYNKKKTGMGQKPSDAWILPLTRSEHEAQHRYGNELRWWELQGISDPFWIAGELYKVTGDVEAGIDVILRSRSS